MAKKKKAVKSPKDEEAVSVADAFEDGPEVSPYTSPSCSVYFKGGTPFIVPRDIIRVSVELDRICNDFNDMIRLEEVPDEAGHVLVHYLYTCTWQTLRKRYSLQDSEQLTQVETGLYVYAAAQTYGLTGLAELAKENISRYASGLSAIDIIVLAAKPCEILPDDDSWFSAFVKMQIEQLFEDPASLNQSVFLECFNGATRYSRVLAKGMVLLCCEKSASLEPAEAQDVPVPDAAPSTGSLHPTPDLGVAVPAEPEEVLWAPVEEPAVETVPDGMPVLSISMKPEKKSKKKLKKAKKSKEPGLSCSSVATHVVDGGREALSCSLVATHVVNGEWEHCASCREFVGDLSTRYGSSTMNAPGSESGP
ncbi:hypothetical protein LZ30DRAFT_603661 [Colletotrichum cereale]|nr:hypothetical protein LZ30DRAFT_603661 [Colletotrichum cereale]